MPRTYSSDSRSRSPKRIKRFQRQNSSSQRQIRKHYKNQRHMRERQRERQSQQKPIYNIRLKSDIKHHVKYTNIKLNDYRQSKIIMQQVKEVLQNQFGPITVLNKLSKDEDEYLSFGVGFKYDQDALRLYKEGGYIRTENNKKIYAKFTPIFEYCIPMIKAAQKMQKSLEERSQSRNKKKSYGFQRGKKRSSSQSSERRFKDKFAHKKAEEISIWLFGLPSSIKGKEVSQFFQRKMIGGPYHILHWKWARVKGSNCEVMQATLNAKKGQKLLSSTQMLKIEGYPVILTSAQRQLSQEAVKFHLKQYQFRISFPQKIHPSVLYNQLKEIAPVVQILSCNKLVDGCSQSYTVTMASSQQVRDLKRLYLRQQGVRIQESRGQLVYRPTKASKLTDKE